MCINVSDGQYATVWSVEDKGKYADVELGTSRKDKRDGQYKNSSWGKYVKFVGAAHDKVVDLPEKTRIQLKGATLDMEPYLDSTGAKVYPTRPHFTVFNFVVVENDGKDAGGFDTPPVVNDTTPEDEMPF